MHPLSCCLRIFIFRHDAYLQGLEDISHAVEHIGSNPVQLSVVLFFEGIFCDPVSFMRLIASAASSRP